MTNQTFPSTDEQLRQGFKKFNPFMIWMWRLGLRRYINACPPVMGRIMVLTHTGRKSGLRRQTPVNYEIIDGDVYCTAGFGPMADWYRNILKNPQVEIWLPDSWWAGVAEDVSEIEDRLPILRQVLIASGFAAPMMGVEPKTMSDAELAEVSAEYRLVRIRRTRPLDGPGGPGDLAWVWLPVTLLLTLIIVLSRRRCCAKN